MKGNTRSTKKGREREQQIGKISRAIGCHPDGKFRGERREGPWIQKKEICRGGQRRWLVEQRLSDTGNRESRKRQKGEMQIAEFSSHGPPFFAKSTENRAKESARYPNGPKKRSVDGLANWAQRGARKVHMFVKTACGGERQKANYKTTYLVIRNSSRNQPRKGTRASKGCGLRSRKPEQIVGSGRARK